MPLHQPCPMRFVGKYGQMFLFGKLSRACWGRRIVGQESEQ
jgi:hypothetical protein